VYVVIFVISVIDNADCAAGLSNWRVLCLRGQQTYTQVLVLLFMWLL